METKFFILLNLVAYSLIVSQSFSYIISLTNVQKNLSLLSYIDFRKLTDRNYRAKFKFVFYTALITGPVVILLTLNSAGSLLFVTSVIAYALFCADAIIMLKGNMPINNTINAWSAENYPPDWTQYRDKWLSAFRWRQIANITGFISLLVGVIFG